MWVGVEEELRLSWLREEEEEDWERGFEVPAAGAAVPSSDAGGWDEMLPEFLFGLVIFHFCRRF